MDQKVILSKTGKIRKPAKLKKNSMATLNMSYLLIVLLNINTSSV